MTRGAKIQAAKAANQDKYSKQVIVLGDYTVKRGDEYNWVVVRKGKELEPWYYGKLLEALKAVPHKMLNDGQYKSLEDILETMKGIEKEIDRLGWTKFEKWEDS